MPKFCLFVRNILLTFSVRLFGLLAPIGEIKIEREEKGEDVGWKESGGLLNMPKS